MSGYSPEAEQHARRLGFNNANEMLLFMKHREMKDDKPVQHPQSSWGGLGPPDTWLAQIKGHPMHPMNLLNYVNELFKGVNNGD